jgi:MacB-like periplasmic core domain
VNWLANVARDTQYVFRMFRRDPGFSALAMLMLALGIGANVATFSVMDAILLKMLPVKDPASLFRTVRLTGSGDDAPGVGSSYHAFQLMHEREGGLADLMAYQPADEETVTVNGATEQRHARQIISGSYFEVLGVRPAFGRIITSNDDREPGQHPVAVVSDRLWKEQFDRSPTVVGSKVRVGDQTFEIIGVAPRHFFGVEIGKFVDVWTPIAMARRSISRMITFSGYRQWVACIQV